LTSVAEAHEPALRVLVVDDSAVVRQLMRGALGAAGMDVQSVADPIFALTRMRSWPPDVIVLDLEMPRMDGLTFLRVLRAEQPVPVVICSGVAGQRTVLAMRALEEGAVDIVARPRVGAPEAFEESFTLLRDAIQAAAQARPRRRPAPALVMPRPLPRPRSRDRRIIAIGASTGGTEALHALISALPADAPPVVVVQHMPEGFTAAFAARLDDGARVRVKEAAPGDRLDVGTVLIAPGGRHLRVRPGPTGPCAEVVRGPLVSRHRPSVDVLFQSVAALTGHDAIGVMLTGMGDDGTDGMRALRAAGARTLAQDEASCVVFGMPKAAIDAGVVDEVVPLERMAAAVLAR
jgi:two-component system, chemotaxis family, protein-glutamate methylesterase/glutaminase